MPVVTLAIITIALVASAARLGWAIRVAIVGGLLALPVHAQHRPGEPVPYAAPDDPGEASPAPEQASPSQASPPPAAVDPRIPLIPPACTECARQLLVTAQAKGRPTWAPWTLAGGLVVLGALDQLHAFGAIR